MTIVRPGFSDQTVLRASSISAWGRFLAYLYFIRFSLLLWISMPALAAADWFSPAATATRGIVTLSYDVQFFFVSMVVVLTGWAALLSARIVVAYGEERFGIPPPARLRPEKDMSWRVFLAAQIPGILLLAYAYWRTVSSTDGALSWLPPLFFFVVGAIAATAVWYCLTLLYYWIYPSIQELEARGIGSDELIAMDESGMLDPKAFAAPVGHCRWLTDLTFYYDRPSIAIAFDDIFSALARWLGPGFCRIPAAPNRKDAVLHSGQALALLVWAYLLLQYLVFFYFTAPIRMPRVHAAVVMIVCLGLAFWLFHAIPYWREQFAVSRRSALASIALCFIIFLPVWILILISLLGCQTVFEFPVLGSVCTLVLLTLWSLAGLAFLLDRVRMPVAITILAFFTALHVVVSSGWLQGSMLGQGEHIVETQPACPLQLQTPQNILTSFQESRPGPFQRPPLIVVTATGGGIHAAVWTSEILTLLEEKFRSSAELNAWNQRNPDKPVTFHRSILMMSSVSGGSLGVDSWLREYSAPGGFSDMPPWHSRVVLASQCSSLEAVAWGLMYPDLFHLLIPLRIFETFDRGWALQAAVDRNRELQKACLQSFSRPASAEESLASLAVKLHSVPPTVPAVALNTTIQETGDRFLLANYVIPFKGADGKYSELLPASSFLDVYAGPRAANLTKPAIRDLPLTAAARLSATFPYVAPMPRVPPNVSRLAYHFGDGGYYDNDGTGSAMEFLRYAFLGDTLGPLSGPDPSQKNNQAVSRASGLPPEPIILIEIRDSANPYSDDQPDSMKDQNAGENPGKIWGSVSQLTGPLGAFYNAGHESITRRNRRELCSLEIAMHGQMLLEHFVFDFQTTRKDPLTGRYVPQPLNWHLTNADVRDLRQRMDHEERLAAFVATDFAGLLRGNSPRWSKDNPACSIMTDVRAAGTQ